MVREESDLKRKIFEIAYLTILVLLVYSFLARNYHAIIICMAGILVGNISFCFFSFKERFLLFWLQITTGVFLIAKPFLETLAGNEWWKVDWIEESSFYGALIIISLSLISTVIGGALASFVATRNDRKKETLKQSKVKKNTLKNNIQVVSMLAFYVTAVFFVICGMEKLLFVRNNTYLEYYSSFQSQLPWWMGTIAAMMKYCLCLFLATFPKKKPAFWALALFECTALFDLMVGIRGTIVLNTIFIVVYYLIRDFKADDEKWFGKLEKCMIAIGIPFMMVFMTAYSSLRSGLRVLDFNIFKMIRSFFVSQGVSFEVVARGVEVAERLPQRPWRNYTFGALIDYILHGNLGQMIFGTEALPSGNNIINGTESNSLSHNLSYLTLGDEYLQGRGWGSSYILENYIDFGYIGVIFISLLLGAVLIYVTYWLKKRVLVDTIILTSLLTLFYIPRAEMAGCILFLVTLQFWVCISACYLASFLVEHVSILKGTVLVIERAINRESRIDLSKVFESKYFKIAIISVVAGVAVCVCGLVRQNSNKVEGTIESSTQTPGAEYDNRRVELRVHLEEKGNYEYQFSKSFEGKEKVVREYSSDNSYEFRTEEIGIHVFYVDIKDENGKVGTLSYTLKVMKEPKY